MKEFILVKVPKESTDYFINNVGCLRYMTDGGRVSSCVEPSEMDVYLEKGKHKVKGVASLGDEKVVVIEVLSKKNK